MEAPSEDRRLWLLSEWETVDNVDSSAMVEAIVGDNLVDLRSDLRGFMGARVEVEVVSTTIDLDAQFEARIVEDGEDETSRSQEVTLSGREVEAARADGYSKVAAATVSSANLRIPGKESSSNFCRAIRSLH